MMFIPHMAKRPRGRNVVQDLGLTMQQVPIFLTSLTLLEIFNTIHLNCGPVVFDLHHLVCYASRP